MLLLRIYDLKIWNYVSICFNSTEYISYTVRNWNAWKLFYCKHEWVRVKKWSSKDDTDDLPSFRIVYIEHGMGCSKLVVEPFPERKLDTIPSRHYRHRR